MLPRCDVVIATRNRAKALERCLGGLAAQTHRDVHVVVVDDKSDESPRPVIDRFGELDIELVELPEPSGPAAARNAGVERAQTDYVVFVDDDILPDRRFIEVHLATVTADDASGPIVSFGPFVQPADWENPTPWNLWEARQAKKEADALMRGELKPTWRQFHTGNNCMPVSAFRAVGGFNPEFKRAEDDELALRLRDHGCVFRFTPDAIAWHYSYRTLEAWLAIPRAYAYYDVQLDRLHPHVYHLRDRKRGLARRKAPMRAVRRLAARGPLHRPAVAGAVGAARVLYRLGLVEPAMGALSVAYDLSYVNSLLEHDPEGVARSGS